MKQQAAIKGTAVPLFVKVVAEGDGKWQAYYRVPFMGSMLPIRQRFDQPEDAIADAMSAAAESAREAGYKAYGVDVQCDDHGNTRNWFVHFMKDGSFEVEIKLRISSKNDVADRYSINGEEAKAWLLGRAFSLAADLSDNCIPDEVEHFYTQDELNG